MWNDNTRPLLCHGEITLSNIDEMYPVAIPNQTSTISMHKYQVGWKSTEIYYIIVLKIIALKWKYGMPQADNSVKNWLNLPISNPKPDLYSSNAHTKFGVSPLNIYASYCQETKIMTCCGQITLSKFDKICPLAIPNRISRTSMHTPSWNPLIFNQVIVWKWKIWHVVERSLSKIAELWPSAIPNQILTIIYQCTYQVWWKSTDIHSSYYPETKIQTDGHMDDQRETITPGHYCVAGYKNHYYIKSILKLI